MSKAVSSFSRWNNARAEQPDELLKGHVEADRFWLRVSAERSDIFGTKSGHFCSPNIVHLVMTYLFCSFLSMLWGQCPGSVKLVRRDSRVKMSASSLQPS